MYTGTGTMNLLEPLLAVVWQDLELWTTREPCRSLGFLKRDSSTSLLQKKKKEFGLIRQVKSYIDNTASSPKVAQHD